jgi:DNA-binding transcriptional MerR regulator
MTDADEVGIGEFARLSRLSPRALRLYDGTGVLEPARVAATGARYYSRGQLERAGLVSALRQVGIPLSEIRSALAAEGELRAERIAEFWAEAEAEHAARRRLVGSLIERLRGNEASAGSMAYAVSTRALPDRSVLAQTRDILVEEQTAVREEFVRTFQDAGVAPLPGAAGAPYVVYYGDVTADSDGPIEWCWPVAKSRAEELAERFPDLTLRTDPAHQEVYVHYGSTTLLHAARIVLAAQSLLAWAHDQDRELVGGMRLVYLQADGDGARPDCDVAAPLR